jgi:GNAT superfamily N-acetyltransferase
MASARAATPDDYGLFTHFFAALEAPGPIPNRDWWERSYNDALFVEEAGTAIGYAFAYRLGRELGHVAHVVVDEPWRGRGLGRVVMDAVKERLQALGCVRWSLYVMQQNLPAVALYRSCGMRITSPVDEVLIATDDMRTLPDDPTVRVEPLGVADDAAVERAFALPEGRIARVRRLPGRTFFVARRDETTVGTISFEESTRTTPFLCATSPAVARALVEVAATEGDVRLFVHNDVALCQALVAAGGRVVRHMLQMEGQLS